MERDIAKRHSALLRQVTPAPSISVVICTFSQERWEFLVAAIRTIQTQTLPAREIIVVVDHNPALCRAVQNTFPEITVIENAEGPGLAGSRNTGIRAAAGDIVAFLDDDAMAPPDWLERLSNHYGQAEVVGAGGGTDPVWEGKRPGWFPDEFGWTIGLAHSGMPRRLSPVRNLIGCNMSFRRAALLEVGGFSPGTGRVGNTPYGYEETELCIALKQQCAQRILLYDPEARVRHRISAARATPSYFLRACFNEGRGKAVMVLAVGSRDGLSEERNYVLRTLPLGVLRGLGETIQGNPWGVQRSGAIVLGLCATVAGYAAGKVALLRAPRSEPAGASARASEVSS